MTDHMLVTVHKYREAVAQILGNRLIKMVLYGSYARGDFRQDSDVDIMILADVKPEELSVYADKIYDITYDFEMEHGVEMNPLIQNIQTYERWKNVYPFFMNVERDGIAV